MSKPYSMAGFRIGFVAGNKDMVNYLATIKGYYDYGIFQAVQIAGIIALRHCDEDIVIQNKKYQSRRDVLCDGLRRIGWSVEKPRASMFVWARIPDEHLRGKGTIDYAMDLVEYAEVVVSPGREFGELGEKFVRIALVENEQRLRQAVRNISRFIQEKPVRKAKAGQSLGAATSFGFCDQSPHHAVIRTEGRPRIAIISQWGCVARDSL